MESIKIMASFSGYSGNPVTLGAMFDPDVNVLTIVKPLNWRDRPDEGFVMVTNLDLPDVTYKFTEDDLHAAIKSYFKRESMGNVALNEAAKRFTPDSKIQRLAIEKTGSKFEISGDVDNGTMAVLALSFFVDKQSEIEGVLDALDDYFEEFGLPSTI